MLQCGSVVVEYRRSCGWWSEEKERLDFAVGVGAACACKSQKQMPPLSDDPRDIYHRCTTGTPVLLQERSIDVFQPLLEYTTPYRLSRTEISSIEVENLRYCILILQTLSQTYHVCLPNRILFSFIFSVRPKADTVPTSVNTS